MFSAAANAQVQNEPTSQTQCKTYVKIIKCDGEKTIIDTTSNVITMADGNTVSLTLCDSLKPDSLISIKKIVLFDAPAGMLDNGTDIRFDIKSSSPSDNINFCKGFNLKNIDSLSNDNNVTISICVKIECPGEEDLKTLNNAGVNIDENNNNLVVDELKFYPNPNSGKFNLTFELKNKETTTIRIYDMNGREVYNETLKDFIGKYSKDIDISDKEKGTYFMQISQNDKSMVKKIVLM